MVRQSLVESSIDFGITAGVRTIEEEAQEVASGASTTMHSRHLPNKQGFGCAIDFVAYVGSEISWDVEKYYIPIIATFKSVSKEVNIPIESGGDWDTFKDYTHIQLSWLTYP